jgi:anti-anti-sigma factor
MHISVEHGDNFATIHLRGEFDTYYCKHLAEQIDALVASGVTHVVLNLRLVKFINSTALGAIIKSSKLLASKGGKLVIARPSAFCRDIIVKVGVDRVVPIFDDDDAAAAGLFTAAKAVPKAAAAAGDDEASVLFAPTDAARIEHFLTSSRLFKAPAAAAQAPSVANWQGVGRMASLDERGLRFTWNGGDTGLDAFAMGQLLSIGTELKIKFRLPLFKQGYCEATASVAEVEERDTGVKIGARFTKIDEKTLAAVRQYASDLKFLKDELRKATGA